MVSVNELQAYFLSFQDATWHFKPLFDASWRKEGSAQPTNRAKITVVEDMKPDIYFVSALLCCSENQSQLL